MSEALAVLGKLQKDMGTGIGTKGVIMENMPRIPTGIFEFDLRTGGGFPQGKVSIVYGTESSGKTNLALLAIAQAQKIYPDKKAVFIDVENSLDKDWAAKLGVNINELIHMKPDFAEQVVDVVEALVYAEDVSIVVIDSIAAMTTEHEITSEASKTIVAGSAVIVSKLMSKVSVALSRERKRGHTPTIICINQIRFKIGVMFGNPEKQPGGEKLRFTSSLTVRVYGKDEIVKEFHDTLPSYKDISAIIQKHKVPIVSKTFEFKMCVLENPMCKVGQSASWKTVAEFLTDYEQLGKGEKGGWVCMGETFKTLVEIQTKYATNEAFKQKCQQFIIAKELQGASK